MKTLMILTMLIASCGARPACLDLCPAGATGLLSNQCPSSSASPRVDTGCVCLAKTGTTVPVTGCEVKAAPGHGTYDYLCEDTCR